MRIILLALFVSSCVVEAPASSPYEIACEYVGHDWYRCENVEVICYKHGSLGVSCYNK
jgi:hypothetical protein